MSDQYGPHSSGNAINLRILDPLNKEAAARWMDATLYTQAQVDALVAAETQRCLAHVQEKAYLAKFPEDDDGGCDGCASGWCQSAVDQACEQRNRTLDAIRSGQ